MNIIDFIIIFIILAFTGIGYYRGFFRVLVNLIEYILSIFLAYKFAPNLAEFLTEEFMLNDFFDEIITDLMKKTIESNLGDSTVVPVESLDLPIIDNMVNMIVVLIAGIILFFVFRLLIKVVGLLIEQLTKLPILKEFNKLGGVIIGFVEGILIVFVMLAGVNLIKNEAVEQKLEESLMGDTFSSVVANFTISLVNKL